MTEARKSWLVFQLSIDVRICCGLSKSAVPSDAGLIGMLGPFISIFLSNLSQIGLETSPILI